MTKRFCRGSGLTSQPDPKRTGIVFDPIRKIATPWVVFQGTIDKVCDANATQRYVDRVNGAEIVILPKVGHGYSVPKNWMPQFREAFRRLAGDTRPPAREPGGSGSEAPSARADGTDIANLPLVEVPAAAGHSEALAFIASGDGGWASIDREVGGVLANEGIPVVGLDTLQYYWQPRTPAESARALEQILRHYLAKWGKERVMLIGYSRGADVLPFMASRLPNDLAKRINLVALLGPEPRITFEFHYTDWLGTTPTEDAQPVQAEVEKLSGWKLLCVYGADEKDSICPRLPAGLARIDKLQGGHHFGGDYQAIADRILAEARR